jgi:hypothetical protein
MLAIELISGSIGGAAQVISGQVSCGGWAWGCGVVWCGVVWL